MTDKDYWIEPYHNRKHPQELETYKTYVTGGKGYQVDKKGNTYCSGRVEKDGRA